MKTIKLVDLIVKIANKKDVPKKIKYDDNVMFYSTYDKDYLVNNDDEIQEILDKVKGNEE